MTRRLISIPVGILIFITLGWLAIHSSKMPYNVLELFDEDYPLLKLFIFSCLLYWCFGIPVCMALWISTGRWIRIPIFSLLVVLHGTVAYGFLRIAIPMESIHDIVGSPILNWPWEWELLGRFVSLFTVFSLFLTGGVFVWFLHDYNQSFRLKFTWRWIVVVSVLLPIAHWVVVKQASTCNLTELMSGDGTCISTLLFCGWIFIIGGVGSMFSAQAVRYKLSRFVFTVVFGLLSIPLGYFILQFATENVIYKYDRWFSAMQFLFSPNRSDLVGPEDLIFRYTIFHILIVGIIAITQYPFSRLFVLPLKSNGGLRCINKLQEGISTD